MRNLLIAALMLFSAALNAAYDVGEIAVVHGGPNIASGLIGAMEQIAAQEFYKTHGDLFDFVVVYTTFTPQMNMQQGLPITYTATGINREGSFTGYGPASKWGSAGKLKGGVRMCHIDQYPEDPDKAMPFPLSGLSSVELLAHEQAHYWLAAMDYKRQQDSANRTYLRGYESDAANQHWNSYLSMPSGPSVMYSNDIRDNGDGTFTLYPGTPRKFSELDQYVMGLRLPADVQPFFHLYDDVGSPAIPPAKTGSPNTIEGAPKIVVTIEDVIRAMGERKPSAATAQHDFNVAFIILNQPGIDPFPNQIQKLDALRVRYQEWFKWATDGRGTICTELDGDCSNGQGGNDGDITMNDTDTGITADTEPLTDTEMPDESADAATTDTGTNDTAQLTDTNTTPDNSSVTDTNEVTDDSVATEESGCGCSLLF